MKNKNKIVFLIEGGRKYGLGHFYRISLIAKYIRNNFHLETVIIVGNELLAKQLCKQKVRHYNINFDDLNSIKPEVIVDILQKEECSNFSIDVKSDHDPSFIIGKVRSIPRQIIINLIENNTQARLLADTNIYPVAKELIRDFRWNRYKGKNIFWLKILSSKK
jgi:hypothetical protein